MGRIRRSFDISFKIRVCEAIDRGERTVLEVCREYQVQRPVVEGWLPRIITIAAIQMQVFQGSIIESETMELGYSGPVNNHII